MQNHSPHPTALTFQMQSASPVMPTNVLWANVQVWQEKAAFKGRVNQC
jgi:hypothetical protein